MKFLRTELINDPLEIMELTLDYPVLEEAPPFKALTLHGARNSPARFDLYRSQRPAYNEHPVATYSRANGEWVKI